MDFQMVNTGFVLSFMVIWLLFLLPLPSSSKFMTILDLFSSVMYVQNCPVSTQIFRRSHGRQTFLA